MLMQQIIHECTKIIIVWRKNILNNEAFQYTFIFMTEGEDQVFVLGGCSGN